jgi:hypothetical protein
MGQQIIVDETYGRATDIVDMELAVDAAVDALALATRLVTTEADAFRVRLLADALDRAVKSTVGRRGHGGFQYATEAACDAREAVARIRPSGT